MSYSIPFPQPENLTKERLKQELRKNGVPFEPNENKDYYVRLYRSRVAHPAARRTRGEFSSDEELVRRSPRFGGKTQKQQVRARCAPYRTQASPLVVINRA